MKNAPCREIIYACTSVKLLLTYLRKEFKRLRYLSRKILGIKLHQKLQNLQICQRQVDGDFVIQCKCLILDQIRSRDRNWKN